jgi:hypothetical protein
LAIGELLHSRITAFVPTTLPRNHDPVAMVTALCTRRTGQTLCTGKVTFLCTWLANAGRLLHQGDGFVRASDGDQAKMSPE